MPLKERQISDLSARESGADERAAVLPGGAVRDEDAARKEGPEGWQSAVEAEVGELGGEEGFDVGGGDGHDQVDVQEAQFPCVA